jgi:sugar phosphate isomerase/epimerase
MRYGVSTVILNEHKLKPALERIAAAGFQQVEISAEPPHLMPGQCDPQEVAACMKDLGLTAPVGHGLYGYGSPNLSALDETQRTETVAYVQTCFEPLMSVGAEIVVLHPTGYSLDRTETNRQPAIDQALRSMEALARVAGRIGLNLAWENLPHHNTARPLHDMVELRSLIDEMPPHVGLCLDTTHALISGHDPLEQLNVAGDRLFCLHLHDSDGQEDCHWTPGKGVINWTPFIARLNEINFTGPRTLEVMSTPKTEDETLAEAAAVARKWELQGTNII